MIHLLPFMCGIKTFFSISRCSSSLLSNANKSTCAVTVNPGYMLLYAVCYVLWSVCVGSSFTMMNEHQRWSIVTAGSVHVGMRSASQKQPTLAFNGEVSVSLHTLTSQCATSSSVLVKLRQHDEGTMRRLLPPLTLIFAGPRFVLDIRYPHIFNTCDQINAS